MANLNDSLLGKYSHRRFNPLTREWVLVSPNRTNRPWQGKVEQTQVAPQVSYDPECYLCPGNVRANGARNPDYTSTFAFENDFAALCPDIPELRREGSELLTAITERGICRVLCFSPRHDLRLSLMEPGDIRIVVEAWISESRALAENPWVAHIQLFENRGQLMGASNPHPHCQIWATMSVPNEPARELESFREYAVRENGCLLCHYLEVEQKAQERIVCENESFLVVVPFWAVWPFEVLVLSKRHVAKMSGLTSKERDDLADIIKRVTTRYDNVFETPFPYTMGFHEGPVNSADADCHLHAHYYPPLLRSATVQKFMVGFELLSMPQRDIEAEEAARRLRDAGEVHYQESKSK